MVESVLMKSSHWERLRERRRFVIVLSERRCIMDV